MMINESTRIKQAQENFYQYCLNNFQVGRYVTQEDKESIERVRMSNLKSREVLFAGTRQRTDYGVGIGYGI